MQGKKYNNKGFQEKYSFQRDLQENHFTGALGGHGAGGCPPSTPFPAAPRFPLEALLPPSQKSENRGSGVLSWEQRCLHHVGRPCWENALGFLFSRFWRRLAHLPAFPPVPWGLQILPGNSLFAFRDQSCFAHFQPKKPYPLCSPGIFLHCKLRGRMAGWHPLCLSFTQGMETSCFSWLCCLKPDPRPLQSPCLKASTNEGAPSPQTSLPTAAGSAPQGLQPHWVYFRLQVQGPFPLLLPLCPLLAGYGVSLPGRSIFSSNRQWSLRPGSSRDFATRKLFSWLCVPTRLLQWAQVFLLMEGEWSPEDQSPDHHLSSRGLQLGEAPPPGSSSALQPRVGVESGL